MQIVSERGGNTREVGSIGEQFTVLPNSSDVDASTPQDPDFALRRVSSGCDGRSGKEDGHGRWQCSFRVARVCLTLESLAMSTSICRNLFLLQDNESSYCEQGQHRVQTGLEGLKEMAVIEEIATRMPDSAPSFPSLDNSPGIRFRAPTISFKHEKAAPFGEFCPDIMYEHWASKGSGE
ncbi:hypothetical protein EDD85DRAFT_1025228 [Armillaria nabsnona]|nr:hypothetical protein EDD85DRAFT_1025228 [Armillaria nabsnona]